jgi:hypothetical protein
MTLTIWTLYVLTSGHWTPIGDYRTQAQCESARGHQDMGGVLPGTGGLIFECKRHEVRKPQ